jgi:rhomboid family GlyGly-CTERM serine protease
MNTLAMQTTRNPESRFNLKVMLSNFGFTLDVMMLAGLIILLNLHLLGKGSIHSLIILPAAVESGEWWRLFSHPFVHITWYHLFLDAGAFLLLYAGLEDKKIFHRLTHVLICGAFSLSASWIFSTAIHNIGLCGLSGIAHGLMAVSALEMMRAGSKDGSNFKIGIICLTMVISKSIYEIIIGDTLFSFLQFGLCGTPLVACHAGGVIGGIISFGVIGWINKLFPPEIKNTTRLNFFNIF